MVNSLRAVGVAQLVERRSVAPNVAGSIPVSHPNLPVVLIALRCAYVRRVRRDDPGLPNLRWEQLSWHPLSTASFDSTYGARIGEDCRHIIQLGADGSYSAGGLLLFGVHAMISWQHAARDLRRGVL